MKKALALILTLIMVLGLMPAAMAATAAEGEVTITKTLDSDTPDANGNYTIKLTVQGNPITQSAQPNADVVLVVDCSGSMAPEGDLTYGECGSTEFEAIKILRHYYICKKCGAWYKEKPTICTNEVLQITSGVDRMSIAKQASKIFAEGILTNGSGNKMAVIGFAGSYGGSNDSDAIKVSQDLTNDLDTINTKIGAMSAEGGTNYTAALQRAYDILNDRQDKNRPGYVIFISDGAPGYSGESPNDADWNGQNQVDLLKNAGITIYTIGIALDDTSANYLKSMATDEAHFNNLSDQDLSVQLAKLLAEWAGKINRVPAGTNAVMTDVINTEKFDYVEGSASTELTVSEDKTTLTWNIGNIPEEEQSVTFKVKPKGDWTGTENTNVSCTLTYKDYENKDATKSANSPQVKIAATTGEIVVRKNVVMPVGDNTRVNGREYSFTITQEDGTYSETKTVTIGDNNTGSVTFESVPFGNYTVTESDAGMQGYAVTTTSDPANGKVTVSDTADGNITFTNTYTKTEDNTGSLTIEKVFSGITPTENTFPDGITFTIQKVNDDGTTAGTTGDPTTVTLPIDGESNNPWSATVDLAPGTYTVTESDAEVTGYDLTVSNDKQGTSNDGKTGTVAVMAAEASTITFTNTYTKMEENTGSLTVKKTVSGGGASYNKEFTFTVTLKENNDPHNDKVTYGGVTFTNGVATFTLKHNQEKSITGIPAGYTYTVTENADGYTQSITSGSATGTIEKGETATVTFNNYKSGGDHYYPTPDPVPPIVIPPNTGDMTIWQSILHFLGIR